MRNITGQAVSGDDFFHRPREIKRLWKALESGSNILITAPRRVGKTSILFHFRDNPQQDFSFVYIITESIDSENEFYKRLYVEIAKSDFIGRWEKAVQSATGAVRKVLDKIKGFRVGGTGIDLNKSEEPAYFTELVELLESLRIDERLIILLDEFPQTVENIIRKKGNDQAIRCLQTNRELRHNPNIKNIQFVYTGSIGLENVVGRLGAINEINDLNPVKVEPLTREQAEQMVHALLENLEIKIDTAQMAYLLDKIEWLIPYHIQLFIKEIDDMAIDDASLIVSNQTVDQAIDRMIETRAYFEYWQSRIRKSFSGDQFTFAENLLSMLSQRERMASHELFDIASKHGVQRSHKEIIRSLVHDGYINNNDDPGVYRFNSPLLRIWWKKNVAN